MSGVREDDYRMISELQHFSFCRRQWALICLEQQWAENTRTVEGSLLHERAHDESKTEKRGDLITMRGMRVVSHRLRLNGACDVVEFHADPDGVTLQGYAGTWRPVPVEYKHGHSKESNADRLQLCAQAMALEEMLVCNIPEGVLYYAETRRRERVPLTPELRSETQALAEEMWGYFERGHTPVVKGGTFCNACSLKDLCLPKLARRRNVAEYIRRHWEEEP